MQAAFHSPFLQALGYAIANSLWQMALVWILFSFIHIIFKPVAANKYRLGIAAQLIGFIWFVVTLQFYLKKCSDAFASNSSLYHASDIAVVFPETTHSFSSVILNVLIKAEQLLPFLSFAYLLLLGVLLIRWTNQYYRTQFIRSKGLQEIDEQWKVFVERIAEQLHIYNKIEIYVSELIKSPLTIGFVKPIILVPLASINHLTVPQLEAVLLHEIAHIKRYDYLLNIIISVVETTLFFNPFTQLIGNHIKRERENSCDDWVLQFKYNPAMYAEALLQIAYLSNNQTPVAPSFSMNATKQNGDLLSRVKRIIGINDTGFKYRYQLLSLLLITGILSSAAWITPASFAKKQTVQVAKKTESIVVEPMAAKIDNPLFNPVFFLKKPLQKEVEKNIKLIVKNINVSEKVSKQTNEMLATIAPAAVNTFNDLEINDDGNDAVFNLNAPDLKELNAPLFKIDTAVVKNKMQHVFGNQFSFPFEKINAELKKAKKEIERSAIDNQLQILAENKKWKDELNKIFVELNSQDFPFTANVLDPKMRREINVMMRKADSVRMNKIRSIQHMQHQRLQDEKMIIEAPPVPFVFVNNNETENPVQKNYTVKKTISVVHHDQKSTGNRFEIIFTSNEEQNNTPHKILIEVQNK
ncbi:regulatory protein BlaR1 [mine drainage metagenome]|uniref:Regulatory protein BlaR1 n=1 Tax=mine drainage metagenome TaxID=410659 RepID=A0A1J5RYC1_9ZZZZ